LVSIGKRIIISILILVFLPLSWLVASWCARQIWYPAQEANHSGFAAQMVLKGHPQAQTFASLAPSQITKVIPNNAEQVRLAGVFSLKKPSLYGFSLESNASFELWVDGNLALTHQGRTEVGSRYLWLWPGRHFLEINLSKKDPGQALELALGWSQMNSGLHPLTRKDIYPGQDLLKKIAASHAVDWSEKAPALFLWLVLIVSIWLMGRLWFGAVGWRWSKLKRFLSKTNLCMVLMVACIMSVAAFYSFLSNRPDYGPQLRISDNVPIWWQYNKDSPTELYSAAKFPFFFKVQKDRINRPLYPVLVWATSGLVYVAARPFGKISALGRTVPAHFIVKFLIVFLFCLAGFRLFREFMGGIPAFTALGLMLTQRYAFDALATVHTYELQFITPVFVAFFLLLLSRDYSTLKNIGFSLIIGVLLLGRPNYSSYLAALIFGIYNHRFKASILSFLFMMLPLADWLLLLKIAGLEYYFASVQTYGGSSWLSQLLYLESPLLLLKNLFGRIWAYSGSLLGHIWGAMAAFSMALFFKKKKLPKQMRKGILIYLGLSILINFGQYLAVGYIYARMSIDLWFWVFGFAAYGLVELGGGGSVRRQKWIAAIVLLFSFSSTLLGVLKLPWVSPFNQIR
jgi:hypothetical protein